MFKEKSIFGKRYVSLMYDISFSLYVYFQLSSEHDIVWLKVLNYKNDFYIKHHKALTLTYDRL